MADKNDTRKQQTICPNCRKTIATTDRVGSLTSYLFQPFNCNCSKTSEQQKSQPKPTPQRDRDQEKSGNEFCPNCGLRKTSGGQIGSLTGFLFQDTRCKCPPEINLADDDMAKRFWRLKEVELGNSFATDTKKAEGKATGKTTAIDLLPGAIIGGVYRIIRLIGQGGMGEVYLAQHLTLNKTCALKLIPPDQVTDRGWQRFQNEAKSIAGLDHANLVKVTDLGIHEGCLPFFAMEYIDGQTLADLLQDDGALPLKAVLDIFVQVCDGVDYAHRNGLIHRDLKPANIMLSKTPAGKYSVKILDFGLVKLTQQDRHQQSLTSVGEVFGSPLYMSPEQCLGSKIDNRSDIYSLGCTMFESLTGRPPFVGQSPVEIVTQHYTSEPPTLDSVVGRNIFPQSMEVIIAKLLRKNPAERYQTLAELRGDLEKVSRGEDVQPFYVSRSQLVGGTAGLKSKADFDDSAAEVHSKPIPISRLVAVSLVVSIVVAAIIGIGHTTSFGPARKQTTKAEPKVADLRVLPTQSVQLPAPSAKDTTPYSSIEVIGGQKWKVFHFPEDTVIGSIETARKQTQATGVVRFPVDAILRFRPQPAALRSPSYLKRFREGDLSIVTMPVSYLIGNGNSDANLVALSNIPGVQVLNLVDCDDLSNASLSTLEKFRHLRELYVGTCDLDATTLSKLSTLKQLHTLRLAMHCDVTPIIKNLRAATDLDYLEMRGCTTSLEGLESLAKLPALEEVECGHIGTDDPDTTPKAIQILASIPKLDSLRISASQVSPADLKLLLPARRLTSLYLGELVPNTVDATNEALNNLRGLPKLHTVQFQVLALDLNTLKLLKSWISLHRLEFYAARLKPSYTVLRAMVKNVPGIRLKDEVIIIDRPRDKLGDQFDSEGRAVPKSTPDAHE